VALPLQLNVKTANKNTAMPLQKNFIFPFIFVSFISV
jgi:hypothetical protein